MSRNDRRHIKALKLYKLNIKGRLMQTSLHNTPKNLQKASRGTAPLILQLGARMGGDPLCLPEPELQRNSHFCCNAKILIILSKVVKSTSVMTSQGVCIYNFLMDMIEVCFEGGLFV